MIFFYRGVHAHFSFFFSYQASIILLYYLHSGGAHTSILISVQSNGENQNFPLVSRFDSFELYKRLKFKYGYIIGYTMRSMTSRLPFELSQGELKHFPICNSDKRYNTSRYIGKSKTPPCTLTYIYIYK